MQKLKTQLYKMVEKCRGKWRWKPDVCHNNLIEVGKVTNRRDVLCIPQTLEEAMCWSQHTSACKRPYCATHLNSCIQQCHIGSFKSSFIPRN